ncbi:MAG TPA: hypothetical protein VNE38_09985 [Ktedonobacteraceae bacterium]|nr:hypothetical protein [Ktedonobacteraceae bacterium]
MSTATLTGGHVGHLSYFSRLADASTFIDQAEREIWRRKVGEAKEVCAVMDGADWLQTFTDRHRPDAVRILDFPHAAEHVTKLLEALEHAGMHFPASMLQRCLHVLKHRGPRPLLRMADRLESGLAQQKGVHEHLDYLRKREMFLSTYLLLLPPNLYWRQRLLLFPLHLLCRKPRSPVPVVFPVGANGRPHGIG